ncbi:MAG: TlpA family protein disulfide reductase [Hyphomicrobiales bacterium]|nr:TlpA family protein disulfide reductase [Hyphomicrobiales bacterium]MCP4998347.1 TlpA family protein disulfide reductase [Hyphomicrobiales bacterium]
MSEQKNKNSAAVRIIGAAIVLGLLAGVGAVYVMGTPSGNTSAIASSGAGAGQCSASLTLAEAIQPLARGQVAAMASASEPKSLASLAFNAPDGQPTSVGDLSGKTLLINLWATWCAPCREEMPALDALQEDLGGDNFEVVAVNIDRGDDTKPKNFLNEIGVSSLGFYRDNTMDIFNALKKDGLAFGLPVTLLVDDKGCLLANMNGPAHWSGDDGKTYIGKALEGGGQG